MQRLFIFLLITSWLVVPATVSAQEPCRLPSGYLEGVGEDVNTYGGQLAELNTESPADLAAFYVDLIGIRQQYEKDVANVPLCGIRLHFYFVNLLGTMQDTVTLALAIHADPDNIDAYLEEITAQNEHFQALTETIATEIERLERQPLAIRYVDAEMVNIRSGAGADFETVGQLEQGTLLEIITLDLDENERVWYEFYHEDGTAWVLGSLTSSNPP